MNSPDRVKGWLQDAEAPFKGWSFSYLQGRYSEQVVPWDYAVLARAAVQRASDILDVDTGGGEVLASLAPFSGRATALEGYVPNIGVARERLAPLGVAVHQGDAKSGYPFEDESFDLVLNRHGGFNADETHRVIKPGGVFLTQQVGGDNLADLAAAFGAALPYPEDVLHRMQAALHLRGFEMRRGEEWRGQVVFHDVGALVYFLKAIPWVVENFEVQRHLDVLHAMQARIDEGRPLQFTTSRFLIDAVKS